LRLLTFGLEAGSRPDRMRIDPGCGGVRSKVDTTDEFHLYVGMMSFVNEKEKRVKNPIMVFALLLLFSAQFLLAQGNSPSASSQACLTDGGCPSNPKRIPIAPPSGSVPTPALQHGVLWINRNSASDASRVRGTALSSGFPCITDGDCGDPTPTPTPPDLPFPHLNYFGGPVISNVHVVQVLYGSGAFLPQVSSTTPPSIASFFSDILGTNSGYISLLTQYNTPATGGTNQTIGNGTFEGPLQIVPSPANSGPVIDDTQIQAELLAQINAGHLPAPLLDAAGNVNTLYMIYFPPGITITENGATSCVQFCAYHGTTSTTLNSKHILYGVLPNLAANGCSTGCGPSTTFGNYTSATSRELTEAITDADVGIATTFAFPLAWYDVTYGEIGDICNGQQGSYTANGTAYTIQLEFSNAASGCVLPPAAPTGNFTLSASPASLSFAQGNSGSSTITVTSSGGFTGSVSLSASGLPKDITASFGTNPTTSSSTVTLTASATAMVGAATVTITGTSGALTNTTTLPLNIIPLVSPTTGAAPLTVSFSSVNSGSLPLDHWDFGDGSSGQTPPIAHTYQAAGTYTATPFYRKTVGFTRSVPPHPIVSIVAGPSVVISVF